MVFDLHVVNIHCNYNAIDKKLNSRTSFPSVIPCKKKLSRILYNICPVTFTFQDSSYRQMARAII
jgi:hypothetical protein